MAIGDSQDILSRLQRLIPNGWFPVGATPFKDALLTGVANVFAFIYSLLAYVRLQTRIATATDGFLDLIAFDFFGTTFQRADGQTDASFRNQLISFLFKQRNTRSAVTAVIEQLLGVAPTIIEPQWVRDAGAWNTANTMGYNTAGVWGSTAMPLEFFVTVAIPGGLQIAPPSVAGYTIPVGAYDTASQIEYCDPPVLNPVLTADVYAALSSVLPVTGVAWANIVGTVVTTPPTPPPITPPTDTTPTADATSVTADSTSFTADSD